jgi:pimeloyl-ACP methyl ester carboxylesterase
MARGRPAAARAFDRGDAGGAGRVRVYGCDAANLTYYQLYTDDRNVCRIFEMSIGNGEWKLWREGEHMMKLRRALADPFTVYLPDRRGRGMSGAFGPA